MAILKNTTINDTGHIDIAAASTAARPSAANGHIRMNTSYNPAVLEFYDGSNWRPVTGYSQGTVGTGGTISYKNGGIVHTFTSGGSFTPAFSGNVQVLVVAGGGGGASSHGGGGGGGGMTYVSSYPVSAGSPISVGIGVGGTSQSYGSFANNGQSSNFGPTSTTGGGGGGYWNQGTTTSRAGGSGGGAGSSADNGSRYRVSGGNGTQAQGFPGGSGTRYNRQSDNGHISGGGGGAGGPGIHGSDMREDGIAACGGPGAANDLLGEILYFAGGGGAGPHLSPGGAGNGGIGGGGGGGAHHGAPQMPPNFPRLLGRGGRQAINVGQPGVSQTTGGNAGANTGGGGGGGNNGPSSHQNGGSGVVIVRY